MAISDDLKKAIIYNMSQAEKDKLLIRLVSKDETLVKQLEFKLLEGESTLDERREKIKTQITKVAKMYHYSPGYMMMDMRYLSGDISTHTKTTKDKYGDIELNLFLVNAFFEHQLDHLRTHTAKTDTCADYIAKKTVTILKNLSKLNEDLYVEFESEVYKLLACVHTYCPKNYARELLIPTQWP
jgi:hypothetical protein